MWARPLEARMSYGFSILCGSSVISMVGILRKPWASLYTHISILAKELRPGFAARFGILVAFCFGIVIFFVILNLLMCYVWHYLSCFFLTKSNKSVSRIHWNCSALLEVCFSLWCFQLFGEDPWDFLPSSAPHLSNPSISFNFKCQKQLPTLPHWDLCKTEPH